MSTIMTFADFASRLRWIDGSPLVIEPYRHRLLTTFFDERRDDGAPRYNLGLFSRGKKNFKSCDLILAALYALVADAPSGTQVYVLANDEDQAGDDLSLAKKIVKANPALRDWLSVKKGAIERRDGDGFLRVLPAQDVAGTHGKTYRFVGFDEIWAYRSWDILEALAPDPSRLDAQTWITSYATPYERPGVPLYDLMQMGKAGTDPRLLFSWYSAEYCTDPDVGDLDAESRANPSRASWNNPEYLAQQKRRLPAHKYRRLHLNLGGMPEGAAFAPDVIAAATLDQPAVRLPDPAITYSAHVDMSGGSNDDAVLAVAHLDTEGIAVLDRILDQGQRPPFDPRKAVERFVEVLRAYAVTKVRGDSYAGQTFRRDFEAHGISYAVTDRPTHKLYEAFEPLLNSGQVALVNHATLEQQLIGLVWRGAKIDHRPGEHDDFATAAAGVVVALKDVPAPVAIWEVGSNVPTKSVDELQAERDQEQTERVAQEARDMVDRVSRGGGCWMPGD